jgi:hypothetical protein
LVNVKSISVRWRSRDAFQRPFAADQYGVARLGEERTGRKIPDPCLIDREAVELDQVFRSWLQRTKPACLSDLGLEQLEDDRGDN